MSILIEDPAGVVAGGATALVMLGALVWRFAVECERAWLRAEAAGPEQWELEKFDSQIKETTPQDRRHAGARDRGASTARRERELTLI